MESIRSVCGYPWQQVQVDLPGEITPCCYYSNYGNVGSALGNSNTEDLDDIWNSAGFQDLRRRNRDGDLQGHPCGSCLAYRWAEPFQLGFEFHEGLRAEARHCFLWRLSPDLSQAEGDVVLYEGEMPLPHGGAALDDVRALGAGRYGLHGNVLYFSSSDNEDVVLSGRRYRVERGGVSADLPHLEGDTIASLNLRAGYEAYREGQEEVQHKPTMVTLISTADCNIDCPSCSQNHLRPFRVRHRQETVPQVLAWVPYMHQFTWQGGEPFLSKRFREFITEFQPELNPSLVFGFTSNGTMITAAELEKLKKFPRLNASISIDSFVPETFAKIRRGATLETVVTNLLRCMKLYDSQRRIFSVGMIICKSNMTELAINLSEAIKLEIGLNLSPVLACPVTEQLNVFEDFALQTQGWAEAIEAAREVEARACEGGRLAVKRVMHTGMINELERVLNDSAKRYARTVPLLVRLSDVKNVSMFYPRPGLVVVDEAGNPVAYRETHGATGEHVVNVPAEAAQPGATLGIQYSYDLNNPMAVNNGVRITLHSAGGVPVRVELLVRPLRVGELPRNITLAEFNDSEGIEGLVLQTPLELSRAYEDRLQNESEAIPLRTRIRHRLRLIRRAGSDLLEDPFRLLDPWWSLRG